MKTIIFNEEKKQNFNLKLNFEILSKFEMKKIVGGDGDDDDEPDPVKWTS